VSCVCFVTCFQVVVEQTWKQLSTVEIADFLCATATRQAFRLVCQPPQHPSLDDTPHAYQNPPHTEGMNHSLFPLAPGNLSS
jgi:hypothetical protein